MQAHRCGRLSFEAANINAAETILYSNINPELLMGRLPKSFYCIGDLIFQWYLVKQEVEPAPLATEVDLSDTGIQSATQVTCFTVQKQSF